MDFNQDQHGKEIFTQSYVIWSNEKEQKGGGVKPKFNGTPILLLTLGVFFFKVVIKINIQEKIPLLHHCH